MSASTFRKSCWGIAAVLFVAMLANDRGWLPGGMDFGSKAPIDRVVILHESANDTPAVANITGGKTAQSLRTANKLAIYDFDETPDQYAGLKGPTNAPVLGIVHGAKATKCPFPETEATFATLIKKQGGI